MSYEIPESIIPMKSGAAIERARFVKPDAAAETVIKSTAEGSLTLGVSVEAATAADKYIGIQTRGVAMVKFGGTVGVMGPVESDASGQAVAAAGAASNTCGYALEGGANGEERPVLLTTPIGLGAPNA